MAMTEVNLEPHIRGNNISFPIDFKKNDLPVDYSGWTLVFTMKHHPLQADEDAVLQIRLTVTGASAVLVIDPKDTSDLPTQNYYYDLQMISPTTDVVQTVMTGRWQLLPNVTHTVTPKQG